MTNKYEGQRRREAAQAIISKIEQQAKDRKLASRKYRQTLLSGRHTDG